MGAGEGEREGGGGEGGGKTSPPWDDSSLGISDMTPDALAEKVEQVSDLCWEERGGGEGVEVLKQSMRDGGA